MTISYKKPRFWIGFITLSLLGAIYTCKFFSQAFPIVNLSITMDRDQAIAQAKDLAQRFNWGPQDPFTAVSFETDNTAKTFIELEGGGQQAFVDMLNNHWYEPYQWHVRLFKQFTIEEVAIYFTPDGKKYGFKETIAETTDLPSLKKSDALAMARNALQNDWNIDLTPYQLIEASKQIQPNNRIDRTFVFERSDITLGDGHYRLRVVISGNRLTEVKRFIKIPEAFVLKYQQMRSYNEAIASAGSMFAYIFYLVIGCIISLFVLLRINWVIWRPAVLWALFIATLDFFMEFNQLPLLWMYYKTETSMQSFLLQTIIQTLTTFFTRFVIIALTFTAAESLTRRAFGHHIRLWESWSKNIGNSYDVLGRTIGGYLMVSIDLAFMVTFYMITTKFFGWWDPISHLADPDVLANYVPWFSSIVTSLGAGFLEECKFRAIPLASAALLGNRFGKKKWWIGAAFILQAIVFGAAHANYPAQPAYARLIELIIPSFVFGAIYLGFGLLPAIVSHYTYDVILFALPIFFSTSWINKIGVLFFMLAPLWIALYRRIELKRWIDLSAQGYNISWLPTHTQDLSADAPQSIKRPLECKKRNELIILATLALIAWVIYTPFQSNGPALNISQEKMLELAQKNMSEHNITLDSSYGPYFQIRPNFKESTKNEFQHDYIWQTYGPEVYQTLLGNYLKPARMLVRFLRFEGSLLERAHEYDVSIGAQTADPITYNALNWKFNIPEQVSGAHLEKKDARDLAEQALIAHGYNMKDLYEIKAKPQSLPDRIDWKFVFGNRSNNHEKQSAFAEGELRVVVNVAGDRVTGIEKKIHAPELYKRNRLNTKKMANALQQLCLLLAWILFTFAMIFGLIRLAKRRLSLSLFIKSLIFFTSMAIIVLLNNWPHLIAQFNTQAPLINQLFNTYVLLFARYIIRAVLFAFTLAVVLSYRPRFNYGHSSANILSGVAVGLIVQTVWSIIELSKPSIEPLWAGYKGLGTLFPMLGFICYYLAEYLSYTIGLGLCIMIINYVTDYGKRHLLLASIGSIIVALSMTGMQSLELPLYWVVSSIILGVGMFITWYRVLRFSFAPLFFAVATSFILTIIQQMMFNVLPHNWIIGTCTMGVIICAALYLYTISLRYQDNI